MCVLIQTLEIFIGSFLLLAYILGSKNRRLKYLEVLSNVYTGIPVVASMYLSIHM